jgi:hypothetical protein
VDVVLVKLRGLRCNARNTFRRGTHLIPQARRALEVCHATILLSAATDPPVAAGIA